MTKKENNSPKTTFVFEWQMQVARDNNLSAGSLRLAICLSQELWPSKIEGQKYYCKYSHNEFAEAFGVVRNTIQNWFKGLVQHGHVKVESRRGKGAVNDYIPILKSEIVHAGGSTDDVAPEPVAELSEPDHVEEPQGASLSSGVGLFDPEKPVQLGELSEDEVLALEESHRHIIETIREYGNEEAEELINSPKTLSELYDVLSSSFPLAKRVADANLARQRFTILVTLNLDPSQIIKEVREYVRATEAAGQELCSDARWVVDRAKAARDAFYKGTGDAV